MKFRVQQRGPEHIRCVVDGMPHQSQPEGGLPGRLHGDDFVTAAGSDEAAHLRVGVALEAERGLHLTVVVLLQQGTADVAAIVHVEVAGAERGQMPECGPPLVAMGQQCEVARQATADLVQTDEQSLRAVRLRRGRGVAFPHQFPGQVELEAVDGEVPQPLPQRGAVRAGMPQHGGVDAPKHVRADLGPGHAHRHVNRHIRRNRARLQDRQRR